MDTSGLISINVINDYAANDVNFIGSDNFNNGGRTLILMVANFKAICCPRTHVLQMATTMTLQTTKVCKTRPSN